MIDNCFIGNESWSNAQEYCDLQYNTSIETLTYKDIKAVNDIKNGLIWTGLKKEKLTFWQGITTNITGYF